MRKTLTFFVFVLNAGFAFGETVVKTPPETCDFIIPNLSLTAVFEPNEYACDSGYYLPANRIVCEPCPATYTCNGGTYPFNEIASQGIEYSFDSPINANTTVCAVNLPPFSSAVFEPNEHTCGAGYYLPAGVDVCTLCPVNNICAGGTYSFNETIAQGIQSCASGTFAPTGSTVCYPHILHVGNDVIYLKSTKQTTPSLNIRIGNDVFYANMTTTRTRMNKDTTHYFHVQWGNNDYYVCDDTTCPQ